MRTETEHLIAERRDRYLLGFLIPLAPFFPRIAAAPTSHDENTVAIGALHEGFVFQFSFEANRVKPHLPDVAELGFAAGFIDAKHHIRCPTTAADKDELAVDFQKAIPVRSQLGIGLNDTDGDLLGIKDRGIRAHEFKLQTIQIWITHLIGPPEFWFEKIKRREG